LTLEPAFYHLHALCYFKTKKLGLWKTCNPNRKFQFCVRDLNFFLKRSSFNAESKYRIQKLFLTLIFLENSFFLSPLAKNPRFSRNPSSEGFGEKFLETKIKRTSRNPYKPEGNFIRSAVLKIAYTNFLIEHAYCSTLVG